MDAWKISGEDSFYAYVQDQRVSAELLDKLIRQGEASPTGRARLCLHSHPSDSIHIMLIYHDERTIVPIHRHIPFGEFLLIKDGSFDLIFYDDNLNLKSSTTIALSNGMNFFGFTPAGVWHTLHFKKPTIFFEISQGPFDDKITEFATFS